MVPLYGKTLDELKSIVTAEGLPSFTASQIADWLYHHHAESIDEMTNLSKKAREMLSAKYTVGLSKPERVSESADGTKKYLFPVANNRFVEAAYIPDDDRATLCVSSQSGCKMGCLFCMTAKQGFQGNLSAGEILNQLRSIPEFKNVTNIVYMGMGEPLDNLENVLKSLEILTSKWGMGWSTKRITVSTIGLIPAMKQFLEKSNCHLAISLHTPFDDERRMLMPIQNVYPIADVVDELKKYRFSDHHRVSFEYIMFDGLNDTPRHVKELVKLLNGINCRINLIRFHPIPDSPLRTSPDERIIQFRDSLTAKGIFTTIRASRGQDIQAACGLLSTKALQEKR
ncbi:MAG: 23S rRNA (adenine(2503)-C(2))-methyltransferase RlmN [Tenuifilum sp.]|mgnify:FL=1|uniref:23S rRNA (adenine(2503)-C(2))-methyltransferase RlmN n=1 Tax=Tenuifilum sp. TaxID=2760880 RepID=UPI0019CDF5CB|nr:23S rRNA (adenine(2503)-C(2))-methyltransferase RlmN [Bacteroidales bacterium]HON70729.1 23S rRNA (adenine(2503)-C(2))-methyltransferase RlmN [Tenuifilum sp.]HQE54885.1 23S rRNA (adenine(2503)-C(2))-methyltransferase RlmN [Tenuifilum sp.]HQG72846.1 23S rRNA (adenine(2503)-C(2))-methyltransferase RlmN [Tenuifilum sp.]HRR10471.1 23S rRNA (adenine(2503)-C(2))-methyltransferase RlmN [Tenuifilum sp.]